MLRAGRRAMLMFEGVAWSFMLGIRYFSRYPRPRVLLGLVLKESFSYSGMNWKVGISFRLTRLDERRAQCVPCFHVAKVFEGSRTPCDFGASDHWARLNQRGPSFEDSGGVWVSVKAMDTQVCQGSLVKSNRAWSDLGAWVANAGEVSGVVHDWWVS